MYSNHAEVFALNNLLVAAILMLAVRCGRQPREWARPCHIGTGTWGLALPHRHRDLGLALLHRHRDVGVGPATSAPGLGWFASGTRGTGSRGTRIAVLPSAVRVRFGAWRHAACNARQMERKTLRRSTCRMRCRMQCTTNRALHTHASEWRLTMMHDTCRGGVETAHSDSCGALRLGRLTVTGVLYSARCTLYVMQCHTHAVRCMLHALARLGWLTATATDPDVPRVCHSTDRQHLPPTVRLERPYVRLVGTERALTWGSAQVGVRALLGGRLKWEWALRVRYASAWLMWLQAWRSRTSTRSSSTLRHSCRAPIRSPCHLIPDGYHRVPTSRALCAVGYLSASSGLLCRTLWAYEQLEGSHAVLPSCPA
jgi:hypothetical protein